MWDDGRRAGWDKGPDSRLPRWDGSARILGAGQIRQCSEGSKVKLTSRRPADAISVEVEKGSKWWRGADRLSWRRSSPPIVEEPCKGCCSFCVLLQWACRRFHLSVSHVLVVAKKDISHQPGSDERVPQFSIHDSAIKCDFTNLLAPPTPQRSPASWLSFPDSYFPFDQCTLVHMGENPHMPRWLFAWYWFLAFLKEEISHCFIRQRKRKKRKHRAVRYQLNIFSSGWEYHWISHAWRYKQSQERWSEWVQLSKEAKSLQSVN